MHAPSLLLTLSLTLLSSSVLLCLFVISEFEFEPLPPPQVPLNSVLDAEALAGKEAANRAAAQLLAQAQQAEAEARAAEAEAHGAVEAATKAREQAEEHSRQLAQQQAEAAAKAAATKLQSDSSSDSGAAASAEGGESDAYVGRSDFDTSPPVPPQHEQEHAELKEEL